MCAQDELLFAHFFWLHTPGADRTACLPPGEDARPCQGKQGGGQPSTGACDGTMGRCSLAYVLQKECD
jgi:hypothetical protein